jgi:hypothetical protein
MDYRTGLESQMDSAVAIPHFVQAASAFDELCNRGIDNPTLSATRARAHLLAGELGHAIAAYRQGLVVSPDNSTLETELEYAREQVAYPAGSDLAEQAKPRDGSGFLRAVSIRSVGLWLVGLYTGGCLMLARSWMRRNSGWARLGATMLFFALLLGGLATYSEIRRSDEERKAGVVIGEQGTPLYAGNGEHYAQRIDRLPPGIEARILTTRGEWYQVQLAGGVIGWVPANRGIVVGN